MTDETASVGIERQTRSPRAHLLLLVALVLLGGVVRFEGLGTRSLWLDEFATWRVSQMELGPSLRWAPELSKPPLYQLTVRALSDNPRPSEWLLRAPAAVCGVLVLLAGAMVGYRAGGWPVACGLAGLLACQALQVEMSQQARSYTMLALGSALSLYFWHRLVITASFGVSILGQDGWKPENPRGQKSEARFGSTGGGFSGFVLPGFVFVTVLTFHAHYLMVLTVVGEAMWWLLLCLADRRRWRWGPGVALGIVGLLCVPMVLHYLAHRTSVFQGLDWIEPLSWGGVIEMLGRVSFGGLWVVAVFLPALLIWLGAGLGLAVPHRMRSRVAMYRGAGDWCGLLVIVFLSTFGGLVFITFLAHPAMVARYALPASVPLLLLPLVVVHRLDHRAPLVLMLVFAAGSAPSVAVRAQSMAPGFAELAAFLSDHVDPSTEAVIMAIDGSVDQPWADMERAALAYYPIEGVEVGELAVTAEVVPASLPADAPVLFDRRALYVIVFRADPVAMIQAAGRHLESIPLDGRSFDQLLFAPYRVLRVAAISGP